MAELNIRIDWSELDLYGHVNNVMIFKYVQAARINYCEKIGMDTLNQKEKPGFIVAASNVLYKKKVLYPGQLKIESHVNWIKNTSFQIDHVIYNEHKEVLVEAYDVIVVYDYDKDGKSPVTPDLRKSIEQLEGRLFESSSKDQGQAQYPDIE
jgi:acyl-CoA thioester hydrolase